MNVYERRAGLVGLVLTLLGVLVLSFGAAMAAPENPDCYNNYCNEVYYLYKCTPVAGGLKYEHSDCLFCASSSGRCIDHNDLQVGPNACQPSELFYQWIATCNVTQECNCVPGTAYVEASGDYEGTYNEIPNRRVYNCP